ncbi:putative universal stress protein [Dinoroseobacter shibae DFL 12 = DSM 16493]|jgi:nucleotide-binding universal stress UspA family protein|uniref:Putative universal stress protein n=1 Tax=Dinoroseobacter shibae (strain DSM 16493 / NCIMB 14021 / DFL 12) TaxID=398580 RepID=A8LPS5_DINSH|nr:MULTISPECIES: universal stress protein [Dinoroseobacter]ABV93779.1 putative universal stress protein [Dinoroseobacter shibae DFL 12 = DSM 16493]MDD9715121.1 universal stress protein [Dinoroseobacter sp. PD6]URF45231.1 universal stress protein [Dinoroseobacter shibae]URF49536.1 universal stress protein [Dinoroseobacter shibae]
MSAKILVPVDLDHADLIQPKLAQARDMLAPGGKILVVTVLETVPGYVSEFVTHKPENNLTAKVAEKLSGLVGEADDVETHVITGKPGVEIPQFAEDHGCTLIIVGSHRPGMRDYFLGSTAARVVRRASCSVMVMR